MIYIYRFWLQGLECCYFRWGDLYPVKVHNYFWHSYWGPELIYLIMCLNFYQSLVLLRSGWSLGLISLCGMQWCRGPAVPKNTLRLQISDAESWIYTVWTAYNYYLFTFRIQDELQINRQLPPCFFLGARNCHQLQSIIEFFFNVSSPHWSTRSIIFRGIWHGKCCRLLVLWSMI